MQDLPPVVADDEKAVRTPNVSVGTVKKSIPQWPRDGRDVSQRFTESGSLGARRIHRETLLSERWKPSEQFAVNARCSQVGFSESIRKIRATSLLSASVPYLADSGDPPPIKRNPARCQFTTVLGVTKMSGRSPDQHVLTQPRTAAGQLIIGEVHAEPALPAESRILEDEVLRGTKR
jgi:hypothetical protein